MAKFFNDLESGFQLNLVLSYGRHIIQGHELEHSIETVGTSKKVVLKLALGDGAYKETGEGSWGIAVEAAGGGTPLGDPIFYADANQLAGQGFADGDEVQPSFVESSPNGYVMDTSRALTGNYHAQKYDSGGQWPDSSQPSLIGFTEPLDCSSTLRSTGYTNGSTDPELLLPNEFMIVVVLKPTAFVGCWQNGQPTIITRRGKDAGGDFTGWELFLSVDTGDDTKAFIDFHTIDSGFGYPWHLVSSTAVINAGTSYVITIICDGSTAYLRLNGTVIATSGSYAPGGSEPVGGSDLHYLCSGDGQNAPMGDYPYTKIWNQYPEQTPLLDLEAALGTRFGITMAGEAGGAPDSGGGGLGPITPDNPVEGVWYKGHPIDNTKWHFHPGTITTGDDDPLQGIDTSFPNQLPYSATPYIVVELPPGIGDSADPSGLAVAIKTSCVADYDADGNMIAVGYSHNPARVKADMLKRAGQIARLNWASFVYCRDWYDAMISAAAPDTPNFTPFSGTPTYSIVGPLTDTTGDVTRSSGGVTSSSTPINDNRALTEQVIPPGEDGSFAGTVHFGPGGSGAGMAFTDENLANRFGVNWGDGHLGVLANGVAMDVPALTVVDGDILKLAIESGEFKLYKNTVLQTIPQGTAAVPDDKTFKGRVEVYGTTAAVLDTAFEGEEISSTTPATVDVTRFEAHPAFTGPVDIATALDFVDLLCCSDTQDAGKEIIFLTPELRDSIHTFDEDVNVVGKTVRYYSTDIRERPNRLWGQFRNLDLEFFDQDSAYDLRDSLYNQVGRPIDPGPLSLASMHMHQGQRVIKFEMRKRSDDFKFVDLTGMADSLHVLPADVVTVISRKFKVTVDGTYDDAATDITLDAGEVDKLPAAPFFIRWWNKTDYKDALRDPNMEIVQVTAIAGDVITVVRAQEGTSASTKNIAAKTYVMDRFPKDFVVIRATRESGETTPLSRNFICREYNRKDGGNYRDSDSEVAQEPLGGDPITGDSGAPGAPVLTLSQELA